MAEVLTADVDAEESTSVAADSRSADHPEYVTRQDHEAAILWLNDQVRQVVSEGYRGTQQLFDRKVNEMAAKMGLTQAEAAAVLEELATETVGADRTQDARQRAQAKIKADSDAEELRARRAWQEQQEREAATAAQRSPDPELAVRQRQADALWKGMTRRVGRLAKDQGLEAQPYIDRATKEIWKEVSVQADLAEGMDTFEERVKDYITKAADARHKAEQGRVEVDTAAASGGSGTALENYKKALREGKPLPSQAEIDKITASYR